MAYRYPILKWAGGKSAILESLQDYFGPGEVFVEPFVGSGVVFLNCDYPHYILADGNEDLINTYLLVKEQPEELIGELAKIWKEELRCKEFYLDLRAEFNQDPGAKSLRRSAIFLYMNHAGFHGLCRYNASGLFNVPFGPVKQILPPFPDDKIRIFSSCLQRAEIYCQDFAATFAMAGDHSVIYCDPPYAPLTDTTFDKYDKDGFSLGDQMRLHDVVVDHVRKHQDVSVYISNHSTDFTEHLYRDADSVDYLMVRRRIARAADERKDVRELVATYTSAVQKERTPVSAVRMRVGAG